MAYNKKADANYRKKCNQIALKYTPNESNDYSSNTDMRAYKSM